jgi:hypothetical protein
VLALLLTSYLMWALGGSAAFDRNPNPIQLSLICIAPIVTIAAIAWTAIILRRSRTTNSHAKLQNRDSNRDSTKCWPLHSLRLE